MNHKLFTKAAVRNLVFFFKNKALVPLIIAAPFTSLTGCVATNGPDPMQLTQNASAETLYKYGVDALRGGRYKLATQQFERLEQTFPYSSYTGNAELMAGYGYYVNKSYAPAVQQLERYLQLHPNSSDAPYAFYLRALCYYEQIAPVERDQLATVEAVDALQEVITRFPQTSYARDSQLKIDLCRDHLAGKEMKVGRFYQRNKSYQAAIGRYQRVVQDFQTTNHVPEALERLVEIDLDLGLLNEAHQAASVLGYNYPTSKWYKAAYNHLRARHGLTLADKMRAGQGFNPVLTRPHAKVNPNILFPTDGPQQEPENLPFGAPTSVGTPDKIAAQKSSNADHFGVTQKKPTVVGTTKKIVNNAVDWFFDLGPLPPPTAKSTD